MSMIGNFLLVDDAEIDELLRTPEDIHELLAERTADTQPEPDYVEVDKAWHALHFFLTGTAWGGEAPLNFIAVGGVAIGDEDVGYGPARALRRDGLVALARALGGITEQTLLDRYDGARMRELQIYPGRWADLGARKDDELEYFTSAYERVAALVNKGAESGRALLVWIS